jgi:hypothetical protein
MRTVRIFPGLVLALNHRYLCIRLRNHWVVSSLQPMYEDGKNLSWFSSSNKLQMSLYQFKITGPSTFSSPFMRKVRIFPGLVLALNHRCLCISLRNHWAVSILQPMYEDNKNLSRFSSCIKPQISLYQLEKSLG